MKLRCGARSSKLLNCVKKSFKTSVPTKLLWSDLVFALKKLVLINTILSAHFILSKCIICFVLIWPTILKRLHPLVNPNDRRFRFGIVMKKRDKWNPNKILHHFQKYGKIESTYPAYANRNHCVIGCYSSQKTALFLPLFQKSWISNMICCSQAATPPLHSPLDFNSLAWTTER